VLVSVVGMHELSELVCNAATRASAAGALLRAGHGRRNDRRGDIGRRLEAALAPTARVEGAQSGVTQPRARPGVLNYGDTSTCFATSSSDMCV